MPKLNPKICPTCGEWTPCVRCPEPVESIPKKDKAKPKTEVGNGNVTSKSEVEAVTYEKRIVPSDSSPSRNR